MTTAQQQESSKPKQSRKRRAPIERYSVMMRSYADGAKRVDAIFGGKLGLKDAIEVFAKAATTIAGFGPDWKPSAPMRNVVTFTPEVGDTVTFTAAGEKKYGELFTDTKALTVKRVDGKEAVVESAAGGKARVRVSMLVQVEEA